MQGSNATAAALAQSARARATAAARPLIASAIPASPLVSLRPLPLPLSLPCPRPLVPQQPLAAAPLLSLPTTLGPHQCYRAMFHTPGCSTERACQYGVSGGWGTHTRGGGSSLGGGAEAALGEMRRGEKSGPPRQLGVGGGLRQTGSRLLSRGGGPVSPAILPVPHSLPNSLTLTAGQERCHCFPQYSGKWDGTHIQDNLAIIKFCRWKMLRNIYISPCMGGHLKNSVSPRSQVNPVVLFE